MNQYFIANYQLPYYSIHVGINFISVVSELEHGLYIGVKRVRSSHKCRNVNGIYMYMYCVYNIVKLTEKSIIIREMCMGGYFIPPIQESYLFTE